MEKDGKTRVYRGEEVVYPERSNSTENRGTVDFLAVNSETFLRASNERFGKQVHDEWGVYGQGELVEMSTTLDRSTWKNTERYSKLAEQMQVKTGRKGLTIVVS